MVDDERLTLPGWRVGVDRTRVADGECVPCCLTVRNHIDEFHELVVVVEYCGVAIVIDYVLLGPNAKESVNVVNWCLPLLKDQLAELEGRFVVERGPILL